VLARADRSKRKSATAKRSAVGDVRKILVTRLFKRTKRDRTEENSRLLS
jgi:hypothetical protein